MIEHQRIFPSEDHCTYTQRHPENKQFRTIKNVSRPKEFNKNKDSSKNTVPPQATIDCPCPKVNSVHFDDPYDHINHTENTHKDTKLIDTQEQDMENTEF